MVSMTDHKCGIGISLIFDTVFRYLLIFSYGIAVSGTPQYPFPYSSDTQVRIPTDKSLAIIFSTLLIQEHGSQLQQYFL